MSIGMWWRHLRAGVADATTVSVTEGWGSLVEEMSNQCIPLLIPIDNGSGNIAALAREIDAVVAGLPAYDSRLFFVGDGSSDGSAAIPETMSARDPRIGVIELSRNCGRELVLTAGIHAIDCSTGSSSTR